MSIQRLTNVGIVVDDLESARTVGLEGVRTEVAMLRTADGHGHLELMRFHHPAATSWATSSTTRGCTACATSASS